MVLRTLHARLMLVLALVLAPAAALTLSLSLRSARAYYQEVTQRQNADVAANLAAEHHLMVGHDVDRAALMSVAKNLAMTNPGVEVYLLDDAGRILAGSVPADALRQTSVDLASVRRFLSADRRFPLLGTDPRRGGRTVFSVAALAGGGGYLYVVLTDELRASILREAQSSTALRVWLWGSLTILVLVLLGGALAFALLTRRLRRLHEAVEAFRAGGGRADSVTLTPVPRPRDEIDALRNGFLALTERIGAQVEALRRSDALRRELVTNVSHDLRTPLAALRGSLETLQLRGARLGDREREDLLATARAQSERLGRLIDQLFELSVLEGERVPGAMERFPLAELAHDLVQKEQPRAAAAGVELAVEAPEGDTAVRGNVALLERALANLLDNALRHTPTGGQVRLTLRTDAPGTVALSVCDTGEGIAPEHQAHLFERFYQVPRAVSGGGGAGLGLAIAHRTATLHHGTLRVSSVPGEGTCFVLTLPGAADRDPSVRGRDEGVVPVP